MPLAFESESHGSIAFGFFNIESDMLLLEKHFFFANDFCSTILTLFQQQSQLQNAAEFQSNCPAYCIDDRTNIGDLHGAIAGTHHSGFIGETYKKYPFPEHQVDFKQQTRGFETREEFELLIDNFSSCCQLLLRKNNSMFQFGPYHFSQGNFIKLIEYVIQGGYPGWLNGIAPDYVLKMQQMVKDRTSNMFDF